MELHDWEQRAVDELERDYNRLSDEAKDAFHDVILQWQIHPLWIIGAVLFLGYFMGKVI